MLGGAASGIGRATALRLARQGAHLGLLDVDAEGLALVAKEAASLGAGAVRAHTTDISSRSAVERAVAALVADLGTLDALVTAAGVLRPGTLREVTAADWSHHFQVNTTGVLHCLQIAEPHLRDGAAIVVISSNAARVPRTGMLAYAASKAATSALARSAGLELAARRIRCNVVEPGSTDTAMQRELWPDAAQGAARAIGGELASYRVGIPLGRLADPDDVAATVCFLLSPDARHLTLQQLYVDGGASL